MHGRVTNEDVSADDVSIGSRTYHDPVCIAASNVVLNEIIFRTGSRCGGTKKAYAKVPPLSRVPVSNKPVRTDPAAASAAEQSYAAAGKRTVAISHGDVVSKIVIGPTTD